MKRSRFSGFVVVLALAGAALPAAASAQTAAPPSLNGEVLFQFFPACTKDAFNIDGAQCAAAIANPPPRVVQGECSPTGETTLSFDVAGTALGPYPGTFTEHVTVKIGAQTGPVVDGFGGPFTPSTFGFASGPVLQWDARFQIDAANGYTVTGTKRLTAVSPSNIAFCQEFDNTSGTIFVYSVTGGLRVASADNLSYDATIHGADGGAYSDDGNSESIVREGFAYAGPVAGGDRVRSVFGEFGQSFQSTRAEAGKPGLGCGDKNHIHVREDECKQIR